MLLSFVGFRSEQLVPTAPAVSSNRSGEGRVGEEGRSRWVADHLKKKKKEERYVAVYMNLSDQQLGHVPRRVFYTQRLSRCMAVGAGPCAPTVPRVCPTRLSH